MIIVKGTEPLIIPDSDKTLNQIEIDELLSFDEEKDAVIQYPDYMGGIYLLKLQKSTELKEWFDKNDVNVILIDDRNNNEQRF